MEKLKRIANILDRITEWSGKISGWFIVILTLFVVYEVVTRRLMDMPPRWSYDVNLQIYGAYFMLIFAYALLHNAHVNVDFLYERMSPKGKAAMDMIGYIVFFFPFWTIIAWKGTLFAIESWTVKEYSYIGSGLVLYYVKTVIPIAAVLMLITGISLFIQKIITFFKREGGAV
jgi:TRAP-type mannitol/chloroaromatic compound transport system permease small subunit